ncbi:MAG: porin family protein [Chloroflexi bacterium]|nr:porin family protein [Chloroflexota bacterium]
MLIRLLVLSTAWWVPAASAQGGFYVGVSIGYSQVDGLAHSDGDLEFSFPQPPALPEIVAAGINDVAFADSDSPRAVFIGYRINQYIGVQLGTVELGAFSSDQTARSFGSATVEIDEYALSAKVQYPLTRRLSANWQLGLTRSDFDVDGDAEVVFGLPGGGGFFVDRTPFSAPNSETGYLWGFGFGWKLTPRVSVDLNYTRHDTQVLEVDTLDLGVVFAFGVSPNSRMERTRHE